VPDIFSELVVKVEKQATGTPPPLSAEAISVYVLDEKEEAPSNMKGNYSSSMHIGESIDSFSRMT
jgi:hypothetical protein